MSGAADGTWLTLGAVGALALAARATGSAARRAPVSGASDAWALITVSPRKIESVEVWAERHEARDEAHARYTAQDLCRLPEVALIGRGHDWLLVRFFSNGQIMVTSYPTLMAAKRDVRLQWPNAADARRPGRIPLYDLAVFHVGGDDGVRVADLTTGFLPRITDTLPSKGSRAPSGSGPGADEAFVLISATPDRIADVRVFATLHAAQEAWHDLRYGPGWHTATIEAIARGSRYLAVTYFASDEIATTSWATIAKAKKRMRGALASNAGGIGSPVRDRAIFILEGGTAVRVADLTTGFLPRITDSLPPKGSLAPSGPDPDAAEAFVLISAPPERIADVRVFATLHSAQEAWHDLRYRPGWHTATVEPIPRGNPFLTVTYFENGQIQAAAQPTLARAKEVMRAALAHRAVRSGLSRAIDRAIFRLEGDGGVRVADMETGFLPRISDDARGSRAEDGLYARIVGRWHADAGGWKTTVRLYGSARAAERAEEADRDAGRTGSVDPGGTLFSQIVYLPGHPRFLVFSVHPRGHPREAKVQEFSDILEAKRRARSAVTWDKTAVIYRIEGTTLTKIADRPGQFLPRITDPPTPKGSSTKERIWAVVVARHNGEILGARLHATEAEAELDRRAAVGPGREVVLSQVGIRGVYAYLVVNHLRSGMLYAFGESDLIGAKRKARNALAFNRGQSTVIFRIDGLTLTRVADATTGFRPRITDALPRGGSPARIYSTEGGLAALGEPWPPGLHALVLDDGTRIVRVEVYPSERRAHEARRAARPLRGMVSRVDPDARFLALVLHENQDVVFLGMGYQDILRAKRRAERALTRVYPPLDLAVYEVKPSEATRVADRTTTFLPRITDVKR